MAQSNRELTPEFRKEFIVKIGGSRGKDAVLYNGLLALAHEDERFSHIRSYITQYPSAENKWTAFARAEIYSKDGKIIGMEEADANADNCGKMTAASYPRMALTRAKARAFRDFLNIGLVSFDELAVYEPEPVDPKVVGKIKRIAKGLGIKRNELYEMMEERVDVSSFNDMTPSSADAFLSHLEKLATSSKKKDDEELF